MVQKSVGLGEEIKPEAQRASDQTFSKAGV